MNDALERSISRIVDRCDTPDDWTTIASASAESTHVESEIIESLRNDAMIRSEMNVLATLAGTVELPAAPRPAQHAMGSTRWRQAASLVAACALGLVVGFAFQGRSEPIDDSKPTVTSPASAEVFSDYLRLAYKEGRTVDVLPDVVLEVRPSEESELVEVFTLKRQLERRFVDEVIRTALDDSGQTVALPVKPEELEKPRAF